jgi:hypothetical protein
MMADDPDFLELGSISAANLGSALPAVNGYLKFASIVWIRALGQPTLDGIIIKRWSRKTEDALRAFSVRNRSTELLLRIDRHLTRWSARRGGYIIPLAEAKHTVCELSKEDVITAMLEPASPHRDFYCLACVTVPEARKVVIEVVGPGFDTSDLVRSDLLPHERFEMLVPFHRSLTPLRPTQPPKRTYLITQESYRKSVEDRLAKIGARLRDPAFPKGVTAEPSELRDEARKFLSQRRETLLLRHAMSYQPIPKELLSRFISGVTQMLCGLEGNAIRLGAVTFSGTFTTRRRLVYWDFFPADTRQGHLLYSSGG